MENTMFEHLPKPIFHTILDKIEHKEYHKLSLVSKYFHQLINSKDFFLHQITKIKMSLMNQNPA